MLGTPPAFVLSQDQTLRLIPVASLAGIAELHRAILYFLMHYSIDMVLIAQPFRLVACLVAATKGSILRFLENCKPLFIIFL